MAFTLQIGQRAPDFDLPGVDGRRYSLDSFKEWPLLVVVFSCNHCPYVIGSEDRMVKLTEIGAPHGLRMVAINANSTENHPDDSFENMVEHARQRNYPFPYLRDEEQEIARAYGALRTPHFFLFDQDRKLRYTGRLDDNPKNPAAAATHELLDALKAVAAGKEPPVAVTNPIGCNIKWKGKPEKWMPPEACDLV